VYRASISRTVGRVAAPLEAASARGLETRQLRVATPPSDADPAAPVPGSMILLPERRGGGPFPMQPVHSRTLGKTTRAVRQARAIVVASARATPAERIQKVE
jgi:hypothetical protein